MPSSHLESSVNYHCCDKHCLISVLSFTYIRVEVHSWNKFSSIASEYSIKLAIAVQGHKVGLYQLIKL